MIVGFFMIGGNHTQYGEIVANLAVHSDDVLKFALVFTLLGFAAKAGLVPLHSWLPDAHPAAPSSVRVSRLRPLPSPPPGPSPVCCSP